MSKVFFYIDESKDYKNTTLYLGGIITHLGFHAFGKYCQSHLPEYFPYKLKSTRPQDRQLLEKALKTNDYPFRVGSSPVDGIYLPNILALWR